MQNVGNELRNIAITKVAKAYLCHRTASPTLTFTNLPPVDPLLQDLWLILLSPKIFIREGARDLNIRLDGDMAIRPNYYHHTRRNGLLTVYESFLFSNKAETYLRQEVYTEILANPAISAARIIDQWSDRLDLDPNWSDRTVRTYRNHVLHHFPNFVA